MNIYRCQMVYFAMPQIAGNLYHLCNKILLILQSCANIYLCRNLSNVQLIALISKYQKIWKNNCSTFSKVCSFRLIEKMVEKWSINHEINHLLYVSPLLFNWLILWLIEYYSGLSNWSSSRQTFRNGKEEVSEINSTVHSTCTIKLF